MHLSSTDILMRGLLLENIRHPTEGQKELNGNSEIYSKSHSTIQNGFEIYTHNFVPRVWNDWISKSDT